MKKNCDQNNEIKLFEVVTAENPRMDKNIILKMHFFQKSLFFKKSPLSMGVVTDTV